MSRAPSVCASDWPEGVPAPIMAAPAWNGVDHRVGPPDRRALGHERRFEAARGRRYRLGDRRRRR